MPRPGILHLLVALVAASRPVCACVHAVYARSTQIENPQNRAASTSLSLHYAEGRIDITVCNVSLATVLRELALKTGMRIGFLAPDAAGSLVSASVKAKSLEEGVKTILRGYSYVFFSVANTSAVIVLSTRPSLKTAATGLQRTALPQIPDNTLFPFEDLDPVSVTAPQSLDEFQPIAVEEIPEVPGDQEEDPSAQLDREQAYSRASHQALLNRALAALQSQHTQLYSEAVDQLVGIEDPRATEALVERAMNDLDVNLRVQAVASLSRHAESVSFTDIASVDVLKKLAVDSDSNVSKLARKGLEHMARYQDQEVAQ